MQLAYSNISESLHKGKPLINFILIKECCLSSEPTKLPRYLCPVTTFTPNDQTTFKQHHNLRANHYEVPRRCWGITKIRSSCTQQFQSRQSYKVNSIQQQKKHHLHTKSGSTMSGPSINLYGISILAVLA